MMKVIYNFCYVFIIKSLRSCVVIYSCASSYKFYIIVSH